MQRTMGGLETQSLIIFCSGFWVWSDTFCLVFFCACSCSHFFCVQLGSAAARPASTVQLIIRWINAFLISVYRVVHTLYITWLQTWSCPCSLIPLIFFPFLFIFWDEEEKPTIMSDGEERVLLSHLSLIMRELYCCLFNISSVGM